MAIDRQKYETEEWKGEKLWTHITLKYGIGGYACNLCTILFEEKTGEEIGRIDLVNNRSSFKDYYSAACYYGWDFSKKTEKEYYKTLCTRGEYATATQLLVDEYKRRKANEIRNA